MTSAPGRGTAAGAAADAGSMADAGATQSTGATRGAGASADARATAPTGAARDAGAAPATADAGATRANGAARDAGAVPGTADASPVTADTGLDTGDTRSAPAPDPAAAGAVGARLRRLAAGSFDRSAWPLDRERTTAAACVIAFCAALFAQGGAARWVAAALVLDVLLAALPWRTPRAGRSGPSFWAETLCGIAVPAGAGVAALMGGLAWGTEAADWWWYVVAVGVGAVLVLTGGMNLKALVSGDLAFVYGPTPRSHALARVTASTVSPLGEELVFRGVVLASAAGVGAGVGGTGSGGTGGAWSLGLLAAIAFVARHHLPAGQNRRGSSRALLAEITAAGLLLALVAASGSVWPALLAHALNNAPSVVFELQRERPAERKEP
ncbi:type II CAAX prenyl endopeptidase Rce1 family protein [Streptomyces sp. NPDC012769]|uniref:CPBP family glutamic-type intramembrane protease n=1 Tax=Streptomyces sp. NPDC012769 TaxID=3364848 RepID=UPI003681BC94